ncbi:MAG TPA: hypothetical protein PK120_10535, partial [Syntrophales bacterium]|nr:hypothetical protein [Syntrophales bacterium]
ARMIERTSSEAHRILFMFKPPFRVHRVPGVFSYGPIPIEGIVSERVSSTGGPRKHVIGI